MVFGNTNSLLPFIVIESENSLTINGKVGDTISKTITTRIENANGKKYFLTYKADTSLDPYIKFKGSSETFDIITSSEVNISGNIIIILKDEKEKEMDRKTIAVSINIKKNVQKPQIVSVTPDKIDIDCNVGETISKTITTTTKDEDGYGIIYEIDNSLSSYVTEYSPGKFSFITSSPINKSGNIIVKLKSRWNYNRWNCSRSKKNSSHY